MFDYEKALALDRNQKAVQQMVLDYVAGHLRAQGEASTNGITCMYRGPSKTSCAVGCLIPEDEYDSHIEGEAIECAVLDFHPHNKFYLLTQIVTIGFLSRLQRIHDGEESWDPLGLSPRGEDSLRQLADTYGLKYRATNRP